MAAGAAQEGRGSTRNNVAISQNMSGESQTRVLGFQRNSPPHSLLRSETPEKRQNRNIYCTTKQKSCFFILFYFFFFRKNEFESPNPDLLGALPSQSASTKDQDY